MLETLERVFLCEKTTGLMQKYLEILVFLLILFFIVFTPLG